MGPASRNGSLEGWPGASPSGLYRPFIAPKTAVRIYASPPSAAPVDIRLVNRYLTYFLGFPHRFSARGTARIVLRHNKSPSRESMSLRPAMDGGGKVTGHRSNAGYLPILCPFQNPSSLNRQSRSP